MMGCSPPTFGSSQSRMCSASSLTPPWRLILSPSA
jgi:hypothetical protein